MSLLHWQAGSLPPSHWGSPVWRQSESEEPGTTTGRHPTGVRTGDKKQTGVIRAQARPEAVLVRNVPQGTAGSFQGQATPSNAIEPVGWDDREAGTWWPWWNGVSWDFSSPGLSVLIWEMGLCNGSTTTTGLLQELEEERPDAQHTGQRTLPPCPPASPLTIADQTDGSSLVVQWLGCHAFTAKGSASIPGQETEIRAAQLNK